MSETTITTYRVSCTLFTVAVDVDNTSRIVRTAPITKKFVGQAFANLLAWARRWGPVEVDRLGDPQ